MKNENRKVALPHIETSCTYGVPLRIATAKGGQKIVVVNSVFTLGILRTLAQNELDFCIRHHYHMKCVCLLL